MAILIKNKLDEEAAIMMQKTDIVPEIKLQADRDLEERAKRGRDILEHRYTSLIQNVNDRKLRKNRLEEQIASYPKDEKEMFHAALTKDEALAAKDNLKTMSIADFDNLALLGHGAFGKVRLARRRPCRTNPGNVYIVAVKSMKKEIMLKKIKSSTVMSERNILVEAAGKIFWFPVLYHCFEDEEYLHMAMDFMSGCDLMAVLMKYHTLSEETTKFYMAELAMAITAVHALGYIHRDIKPDNILIDCRGHLKLADFGLCTKVCGASATEQPEFILEELRKQGVIIASTENATDQVVHSLLGNNVPIRDDTSESGGVFLKPNGKEQRKKAFTTVGTPAYIAPEVIASKNGTSGYHYRQESDYWSMGINGFECLFGGAPFEGDTTEATCEKIMNWRKHLKVPANAQTVSPACKNFLCCLINDADLRIGSPKSGAQFETGLAQIVKHDWFKGFDWLGLRHREGPILPRGSDQLPEILKSLETCPKTDWRFNNLVQKATQNFDKHEDKVSNFGVGASRRQRVNPNGLSEFAEYAYNRNRAPKLPTLDAFRKRNPAQKIIRTILGVIGIGRET